MMGLSVFIAQSTCVKKVITCVFLHDMYVLSSLAASTSTWKGHVVRTNSFAGLIE